MFIGGHKNSENIFNVFTILNFI